MNQNDELMSLHNIEDIQDKIFNAEIIKTTSFIPSTPGSNDFILNPNASMQFIVSLPNLCAMVLSESYLFVELNVKSTSAVGKVATFVKPNLITNMLQNMTINTSKFSYSAINYSNGAALNVLSNIFRLRSYTPNQMALVSDRENMTFSVVNNINSQITVTDGVCINNGLVVNTTYKKYSFQLPIDCLLPIVNKVKLISGNINLLFQFNYNSNLISSGTYHTSITKPTNLCDINSFSFDKVYLFYTVLRFREALPTLDIQYLSGLDVVRQQLNESSMSFDTNVIKNNCSMTSPPVTINGSKALSIIIIPQITEVTSSVGGTTGLTFDSELQCDRTVLQSFPIDNVVGNNSSFILNPLFSISNLRVVSSSGMIFPSNLVPQLSGYIDSTSWNFQNSFVQTLGNAPDGSASNSCLTFNQYKNLFQALVVDISNDTGAAQNQSTTYNITFDITTNDYLVNNSSYTYKFAGNIFSVSSRMIGN